MEPQSTAPEWYFLLVAQPSGTSMSEESENTSEALQSLLALRPEFSFIGDLSARHAPQWHPQ